VSRDKAADLPQVQREGQEPSTTGDASPPIIAPARQPKTASTTPPRRGRRSTTRVVRGLRLASGCREAIKQTS
jgi:hypothetical protein